jgi:hypothetical protein
MPHEGAGTATRDYRSARPGIEPVVVLGNADRAPTGSWPRGVITAPWADMPAARLL